MAMRNKIINKSMTFLLLFLCLFWAYLANERDGLFSSNILLWEDSMRKSPLNWFNRVMLGNVYMNHLRLDEAREQLMICKAIAPGQPMAEKNLAMCDLLEDVGVVAAIRYPGRTLFVTKAPQK
jgi:hypothetical protein